jgi:hypothetical protein
LQEKSQENLVELLERLRQGKLTTREIYHFIQKCGEQNFREARPDIERLLKSDIPELRFVSLKVLTRYWDLMEFWSVAKDVLENDPDEECRFRAASDLAYLKRDTGDKITLSVLARVVRNEQENSIVRQSAYAAMTEIIHYDPREQFRLAVKDRNLIEDVDWSLVDSYLC